MTIFNIAKLPIASFKGVEFHYQDGTVDGGRKTVTHEYPDSKNRYVEDLSGLEKKFSINAMIDDNVSFVDRDNLISVLEEGGIGTLIHPTFGEQSVVSIGYSLTDSIRELGVSKISLNFEVASDNVLPEASKGNKGFLANLKSKLLGENEAVFDRTWKSVVKAKAKFDSANKTLKTTARSINKASQLVQGSGDTFSDFTTSINQIVSASASLVQSPSVLASNLRLAFDNLSVAYNSSQDVFDVAKSMFGFSERDRESNGNSQLQKDIKNNQDQINNFVNAAVIALAYNAAGNITYKTLDDLNSVITDLERGFDSLPTLDREIYQTVLDMRLEASKIFSNLAINLPNVADYEIVNALSLNNLVYSLYGSLALKNDIRDLNQFQDTSAVSGTIKILSNV
jgi:hypothetical protein